MTITKYIPLRSILYDLSLTIDDRYWNENKMMEWLAHGFRQLNIEAALETKVKQLEVINHKTQLPSDFKYLIQMVEYVGTNSTSCVNDMLYLTEGASLNTHVSISVPWKVMRLTSNPFHNSICLDGSLLSCTDCGAEFAVSPSLVVTTTKPSGIIMVSYLGHPTDENGDLTIPDDETLKEALLHYVLYRYWMAKSQMMEKGADKMEAKHRSMWATLSLKATGNLNLPDLNQLENLKNQLDHLVPRTNRFQQMFTTLSSRENVKF